MPWKVGRFHCLLIIGMAGEVWGSFLNAYAHSGGFRKCHVWDGNTALTGLLSSLALDEGRLLSFFTLPFFYLVCTSRLHYPQPDTCIWLGSQA